MSETEKGKALLKWQPSDKYRDEFDRIFKKTCPHCGGNLTVCQLLCDPPIPYHNCKRCGNMRIPEVEG